MRSLPFEEKLELVTNTIRKLEIEVLENRTSLLPDSKSMFNKLYFLRPTFTDKPSNKHVTTEIVIHVWSGKIALPVFMLYAEIIMNSAEKINEGKDLWNLVSFLISLIQESVNENNIKDNKDGRIIIPDYLPAGYRFEGLVQ